jgi:hypothetical protein
MPVSLEGVQRLDRYLPSFLAQITNVDGGNVTIVTRHLVDSTSDQCRWINTVGKSGARAL